MVHLFRYVDVGFVDRIIVTEGANITLSGPVELRLRDSLSIDTSVSIEDDKLVINSKDKPKINVYGHCIEITNSSAYEHLKVQKKSASVVEISPSGSTVVKTGPVPFEIPFNDSRIETVKVSNVLFLQVPLFLSCLLIPHPTARSAATK
jgi:hypothetical protein